MSRHIPLRSDGLQALFERTAAHRVPIYPRLAPELNMDQRYCRELTRREAANFYWGFVALPKQQRLAIYALYSFARQVDDEVDLVGGALDGIDRFTRHRQRLDRCFTARADDPVMRVLSRVVTDYRIPREDLEALIAGVEMDLQVTRYAYWDQLRRYCLLVASSVGRMCVRIFGYTHPSALDFADDLGLAMQLANILRDVREDVSMGRIYLPEDELRAFGVGPHVLMSGERVPGWESLMRFEIERASQLFESGLRVTRVIPRRAAVCVLTMAGIYQAILAEIERDPYLPLRQRASLSGQEKLSVMLRSWRYAM